MVKGWEVKEEKVRRQEDLDDTVYQKGEKWRKLEFGERKSKKREDGEEEIEEVRKEGRMDI